MFISLCVTSPGTLSKRNATAMIETTICIFPIDRRSFVSRISQGGTLNDTKIRSDCVSVHVSTDFVSFLYITLTYRVDLFLIHWRSFLHSRVKDRTENREKQWKTVEILCSSRNFLEEVEFTDVVGSFSFYLCRINASENFNINASHISNDVCKVWRTLIRWKWRYWLTRACFLWRKISQKSVTTSSMRRETVKFQNNRLHKTQDNDRHKKERARLGS